MKNELFSIGPFTIYGYGLMIGIGIIAAYFTSEYRAKKKGLDPDKIFGLVITCVVTGMLGAKLLYFITEFKDIMEDPSIIWNLSYGFVVYGGIIGGIIGGWVYCRLCKLKPLAYFDLVIPSVALAQGFGRIGCFLAGCCYGEETSCAFSITFRNSEFAPNNVPLIPTQLISSALDFLNFFALIFLAKRTKGDGQVLGFYLVFYSLGRFIIEFFRGDLIRGSVGPLSTSQFISIFTFLAGIAAVIYFSRKGKKEGNI